MTNKARKLLSICASTLIFSGFMVEVSLNSNPTTVNASKNHKSKKVKEQSKLTPKSKYSSLGAWYINNDQYLYKKYNNETGFLQKPRSIFAEAQVDNQTTFINAAKANNPRYQYGWIIAYANGYGHYPTDAGEPTGPDADAYNIIIDIYNSGLKLINKSVHNSSYGKVQGVTYDANSDSWTVQNTHGEIVATAKNDSI